MHLMHREATILDSYWLLSEYCGSGFPPVAITAFHFVRGFLKERYVVITCAFLCLLALPRISYGDITKACTPIVMPADVFVGPERSLEF